MLLQAIRLRNFRNIVEAFVEPHPRFNVLWGANGQGKTNFLEAVYLLSAVKSFRAQTNATLVRFGADEAMLEAHIDRGGWERIVRLDINERGKKVFLNNNAVRSLSDFFGTVNVVVFGPEDIQILKGSPSERRRFVDRAIFNSQPGYAVEADNYEEILRQRNALLKARSTDRVLFETYDEQLVQYGADIMRRRLEFLAEFRPILRSTFQSIFDESFEADATYDAKWAEHVFTEPSSRETLEGMLVDGLRRTRDEERDRGFTCIGPHRDDLATSMNGRDVKSYASQGQHRAFVLAMKIAEIRYLEERFHFAPILLLDDVSSELDQQRNRYLFDFLRARAEGQVFITTTHRDYIPLDEDVRSYHVAKGEFLDA